MRIHSLCDTINVLQRLLFPARGKGALPGREQIVRNRADSRGRRPERRQAPEIQEKQGEVSTYEAGHRGAPKCRKKHTVQRNHQRGRAVRKLPVLHDRAERRRRGRAGQASRQAGRDVRAGEVHPGDDRIRRHRRPREGRLEGRGPRQQIPLEHPRGGRRRARRALLRKRRHHPRRSTRRATSRRSTSS